MDALFPKEKLLLTAVNDLTVFVKTVYKVVL
jgi:hypothetical protein